MQRVLNTHIVTTKNQSVRNYNMFDRNISQIKREHNGMYLR